MPSSRSSSGKPSLKTARSGSGTSARGRSGVVVDSGACTEVVMCAAPLRGYLPSTRAGRSARRAWGHPANGNGFRVGEQGSCKSSSHKEVVCDTMGGQRAGRANRAPGRCLAGEGVAWRHYLTGRLVSLAYNSFLRSRRDSGRLALLAVHFLPELGRGFAVDRLQSVERTQECAVALALEIAVDVLERHPFERRRIGHACTDP